MTFSIKKAVAASLVASTLVMGAGKLNAMKPSPETIRKTVSSMSEVDNKPAITDLTPIQKATRRPLMSYVKDLNAAKRIVRDRPKDAQSYAALGICYYQIWLYYSRSQFDKDRAIGAFRKMASLDKKNPKPHIVLSSIYHHSGEFNKELKELISAIKKDPKDPELYWYRSELYKALGRNKEAQKDEKTARRLEKELEKELE